MQKAHRCRRLAARLACALLLLAALLLPSGTATTSAASTEAAEVLGHFGGNPTSLTKLGRFLLGRDQQGFVVFDVADPTQIQPYAHVALPATTRAYQVQDTIAYLAVSEVGLVMIGLADPARPMPLGQLSAPGAEAIVVAGTRAYLGLDDGTVLIVDAGAPWRPTILGSYAGTPTTTPIGATAEALYLSDSAGREFGGRGFLVAIDVQDPARPQFVERVGAGLHRMLINQGYGYGHTYGGKYTLSKLCSIAIWGLKDPGGGCFDPQGMIYDIAVYDHRLVISMLTVSSGSLHIPMGRHELRSFEQTQAGALVPSGTFVGLTGEAGGAVTLDDKHVYLALHKDGISRIEALQLDAEAPHLIGEYRQLGWAKKLIVRGHLAYAQTTGGLQIVDLQDREWPRLRGAFSGGSRDMALADNILALSQEAGLALVDVSDPDSPRLRSLVALNTRLLAADGSRLYALVYDNPGSESSTHAVVPIDISDPAHPRLGTPYWLAPGLEIGTLAAGEGLVVAVDVEHAGPGLTGGLTQVLRWPDISTPQLLARITTGDRSEAALIDRGRLFLGGVSLITVHDIRDPSQPRLTVRFPRPFTRSLIAIGDDVYAGGYSGITVIAAPPLATPALRGVALLRPGSAYLHGISTDGELLYLIENSPDQDNVGQITAVRIYPERLLPPVHLPALAQ
jgi:hypothetical protein